MTTRLCSHGVGGDWANDCEENALPDTDLCTYHLDLSNYLESIAAHCPPDWDNP